MKARLSLVMVMACTLSAAAGTTTFAQDNRAAERACEDAVADRAGVRSARVIDSLFSQAATQVTLEAGGDRWTCLSSSDGRVQDVRRAGHTSSAHNWDDDRGHDDYHHGSNGGVTLYEDNDFRGQSETIYRDVRDMDDTRIGEDRLSSIRVSSGCHVRLFTDDDFRGRSMTLDRDESDLRSTPVGNDNVESIEVDCDRHGGHHTGSHRDGVTLYEHTGFGGASETIYRSIPDLDRTRVGGENLSSIRVPSDCTVWLYDDEDYRGRSVELRRDESDLRHSSIGNDEAESIEVECR